MSTRNAARTERLEARLPAEVRAILARASALQGRTLTDFVVGSTTEAARRVIRECEVLACSEPDQLAFAEAPLNPPSASPALEDAARRYRDDRG